jgi:phage gp29-like protein
MAKEGLYTARGEFIEFAEGRNLKSLTSEMATAAAIGDVDVGGFMASMPDPDPVLVKRGDDAEVLKELLADDEVCASTQARKIRVLNQSDYDFMPGVLPGKEATSQAKALVEELTKDLEAIDLRNVFSEILDTSFYGYTPIELFWEAEGGKYRLRDIVAKPRGWFTFDKQREPVLKVKSGEPKPLPWGKFLVPRHYPTYENPYGLRLLSRCLWPVAFKRGGVKFWTRFLDKYGIPWPIGKAPKDAKRIDKQNMAADLAAMVQDAVMVLPYGAEVQLAESKGSAGAQFEKYLQRWDKAIRKVIMGQTLTSEMDGQGSRAAAQVHLDVAEDYAEADQYMVTATMNNLALVYRDINAPNVEAPVFAFHEPEDYDAQADLDKKLYSVGVRFEPAYFERFYGLQPDSFTVVKDNGEAAKAEPGETDGGESFAEPDGTGGDDHQALLDQLIDGILPAVAKQNDKFVAALIKTLSKAETYQDVQLLLAEHLGQDLDQKEQEDLLGDLLAAGALVGIAAVAEEAGGADAS